MSGANVDQVQFSSLSPHVMPFTPRKESYVHSKCGEPTKPNASHLSANVSEFVPSWLRAETAAHFQQSYPTSSKAGDCSKSISQQQFTKKKTNLPKSVHNFNPSTTLAGQSNDNVKNSSANMIKKKDILVKPASQSKPGSVFNVKESFSLTQKDGIEFEFPALGLTSEQNQGSSENNSVLVNAPTFAVSFSEKLRSSNRNNPGNIRTMDKTAESIIGQNVNVRSDEHRFESQTSTRGRKGNRKSRPEDERISSSPRSASGSSKVGNQETKQSLDDEHVLCQVQSDDNGFLLVKSKAKRRALEERERNDEGSEREDKKGSLKRRTFGEESILRRASENAERAWESGPNISRSNYSNSKRFSENRNTKIQSNEDRLKVQPQTRAERPSNKGCSSDLDWRKRTDKALADKVGKEEKGRNVGFKSNQAWGLRADQAAKAEKADVVNRYKVRSTHEIPNASHDKTDLKSNRAKTLKGNRDCKPEKIEREQYKIKVKLGDSYSEDKPTSDTKTRVQLSYSDILKAKPKVQLPGPAVADESERGILRIPKEESEEHEVSEPETNETKKKKKKKKKKKNSSETPVAVKKTKQLVMFDFGDMFAKLEEKSSKKKQVVRAGGLMPGQMQLPQRESKVLNKPKADASNPLDSTAPIVLHRKERETPKKKKPSAMRKILIKEREEKKMLREGKLSPEETQDDGNVIEECQNIGDEEPKRSPISLPDEVKKSIHSRKFREYCDHDLDYDINGLVMTLLKELIRFQDRLFHKDPVKAKAKRRFVCGLREVFKHLKLKRLKCVIVTPNMEPTKSKGGLDDLLSNIIELCHSQNVPVVFSLNRQILGKILLKKVPVSIVGIFSYDGAQNYFKNLMELTKVARETYQDKFEAARLKFLSEKKLQINDAVPDQQEHEKTELAKSLEEKKTIESDEDEVSTSSGTEDSPAELSLAVAKNYKNDERGINEDNVVNEKLGLYLDDETVSKNTEMVVQDSERRGITLGRLYPKTDDVVSELETNSRLTKMSKSNEAKSITDGDVVNEEGESFLDNETQSRNAETVVPVAQSSENIIVDDLDLQSDESDDEQTECGLERDSNLFEIREKSATYNVTSAI